MPLFPDTSPRGPETLEPTLVQAPLPAIHAVHDGPAIDDDPAQKARAAVGDGVRRCFRQLAALWNDGLSTVGDIEPVPRRRSPLCDGIHRPAELLPLPLS